MTIARQQSSSGTTTWTPCNVYLETVVDRPVDRRSFRCFKHLGMFEARLRLEKEIPGMMLPKEFVDEEDEKPEFPWGPVIMMLTIFLVGALMEYFDWYPGH